MRVSELTVRFAAIGVAIWVALSCQTASSKPSYCPGTIVAGTCDPAEQGPCDVSEETNWFCVDGGWVVCTALGGGCPGSGSSGGTGSPDDASAGADDAALDSADAGTFEAPPDENEPPDAGDAPAHGRE
jgi:hypothetical protein